MDTEIYREWAALEQTHWWFVGRKRIFETIIDRFIGNGSRKYICDIGCGAGAMIPSLSKHGKVWGIESAEMPVKECLKRNIRNVIMARSEELPFRDASLDALALFDVIEHITDDEKVLAECHRVCKSGAVVIISVPAYQFLMSPNDIVADHKRRYTCASLNARLERNGFGTIKATYYNTFLLPLIVTFILIRKVLWAFSGNRSETTPKGNISYKIPEFLNTLLLSLLTLESKIINKTSLPLGHSLICVATKR